MGNRRIVTVFLAAMATVVTASPVGAAQPFRDRSVINRTQVSPRLTAECGFPVQVHQSGYRDTLVFFDRAGNVSRVIEHDASFTNTWTNLNTGATVTSPRPLVAHTRVAPDGSSTVAVTGLEFLVTKPGAGTLSITAGRRVWTFDEAGNFLDEIFHAGQEESLLPGLCEALA
jgi:hypothetical protein